MFLIANVLAEISKEGDEDPLIQHHLATFRNGPRKLRGFALVMAMGHKFLRI